MQINSPEELIKAINSLLLQMDRGQRKQFLGWVKARRRTYDFNYPQGYKYKGEDNAKDTTDVAAPVDTGVVEPIPVVIAPAHTGIIVPDGSIAGNQAGS